MNRLSLEDIKQIELDLLVVFHNLCEKNNMYYSLCGGTMLGAIRHKGFIPWDDDIDVMIPRPDYDRLLDLENIDTSEIPSYIQFVSWKKKNMPYPFLKLVDTRTKVESTYTDGSDNHLWIDIQPVDGLPENEQKLRMLYKKSKQLRLMICLKNARIGEGKTIVKKILKPFAKFLLIPFDVYNLCDKLNEFSKMYSFDNSKKVGIVTWGLYGLGEVIDKDLFLKSVDVPFEQYSFKAMSNYNEYLKGLYGDYMQFPPKKDRKTHDMVVYYTE